MKTFVEIEFYNPARPDAVEPYKLTWEVIDKPYAYLWLKNLYRELKIKHPAFIRFSGFENSYKDLDWLTEKLNRAIDIINADGVYHIKERADGTFTQEFFNIIHHHFEVLSGDAKNFGEYYRKSSPMGIGAITDLNHCVHDMEALTRAIEEPDSNRVIVLEFLKPRRFWLDDDTLKNFTFDIEFGDICLHYGLIGKTWLEVYLDQDEEIFPEAIRPLDVLGGEFDIQFARYKMHPEEIAKFHAWLKEQKQNPDNHKLALGFLPLARLMTAGQSQQLILQKVGERAGYKSIRIYDEQKEWISHDFSASPTSFKGFSQIYPEMQLGSTDHLYTREVPVQTYIVSGKEEKTILPKSLFRGPALKEGHSISLMVPENGKSIVIQGTTEPRGINIGRDLHLGPGDVLHLNYAKEGHYLVLQNGRD